MSASQRPLYHVTPPSGWMNDPNGLIYLDGEYHLFYQYIPRDRWDTTGISHPAHWGHAFSPDLIHWTHLPVALETDHLGAIFSGSVVVDENDSSGFFGGRPGLVAVFTQNNPNPSPQGPQVQSIAYSADRGRTWTMYARNPVISNPGPPDFRDPKVFWHTTSQFWVMVVTYQGDRVRFYRSENLKNWQYTGEFGAPMGAHTAVWECPDLFTLPVDGDPGRTRWVLHLSTYHPTALSDHLGLQYFIGEFDGRTFSSDNPASVVLTPDYGRDNYAAITWSNLPAGDDRRLIIGWMNDWAYARRVPTEPWKGHLTVPRELRLRQRDEAVRLIQTPATELEQLRGEHRSLANKTITPASSVWERGVTDAMEITVVIEPGATAECGLRMHMGGGEQTTIGYDGRMSALFVDRTRSGRGDFSPDFLGRHGGPLKPTEGAISLHIYLDRSSVEVFGNDGEVVISSLIFPETDCTGLECYAIGGDARLVSLDVYQLQP